MVVTHKKLVQVDLYKKLGRLTWFLVQDFSCTSFLHRIQHSSIPYKKLACTWLEWCGLIGRLPIAAMFSFFIQTFRFRFLLFSFSCAETATTATAAAAASLSALSAVFVVKVSCTRTCTNLHENMMQETCARNLCKFLAQVSWLCVTTIILASTQRAAKAVCVAWQLLRQ